MGETWGRVKWSRQNLMARGLSSSLFFLNATDVTEAQIRGESFFFCLFPVRSRDAVKREKLPQSEREAKKRCPSGSVGKHISPLFFFSRFLLLLLGG